MSSEHLELVRSFHDTSVRIESYTAKERQRKKFEKLWDRESDRESTSENIVDKDKWIVNLSDKQLVSDNEKSRFIKGMKFAITPNYIPKEEIIAKVDSSLKGIEKPEADTIRLVNDVSIFQILEFP